MIWLPAPLDHTIDLFRYSPLHVNLNTVAMCNRVIPPVNLRQNIGLWTPEGRLLAWMSWLWTTRKTADIFLSGEYELMPEDWSSGDVLVFADFVAPWGHARQLYRQGRNLFPDYPKAEWRRHSKSRRISANLKVAA